MYKYETHLHTYPVSRCASAGVLETMKFYKELGYAGIFITNHFLDGNLNIERERSFEERINFYFSDYEKALTYQDEIGLKVFCGVESSHKGTDFLIYGLDKEWYLNNLQIFEMRKSDQLEYFMESGALVIQAHPFRNINHIRLFQKSVHGVEVINASRTDFENKMAKIYATEYDLIQFAGSDNHTGSERNKLAGMCSEKEIQNEADFVRAVKANEMSIFTVDVDHLTEK